MSDFLTLTAVKKRGWSPKLIEAILSDPDKLCTNAFKRSGPKVKLWRLDRVERAEQLPEFIAYQLKRAAASEKSKAIAERKRNELLAKVDNLYVSVRMVSLNALREEAVSSWEARQIERNNFDADGSRADEETVQRWMVNYARHHLCDYDYELEAVAGKIGVSAAVTSIRRKVYVAIAEAYPALTIECRRQAADRGAV